MSARLTWRAASSDAAGIAISLFGHGALLLLALVFTRNMAAQMPELLPEAIPVEVATIDDMQRIKEVPKPSMEAAPRETITDGAEEPQQSEAEPTPTDEGLPSPDAVPPPTSKGDSGRLNTRKLADLIDKSVKDADKRPKNFDKLAKSLEKDLPQQATLSPMEAATIGDYMKTRITQCFSMPSGAEDIARMRVLVRINLSQDGKVIGVPEVLETAGQTSENAGFFRAFTESTKRAILRCQPYALPADKFMFWREQEINFNPGDLIRQ
jgi:hypothetical protein